MGFVVSSCRSEGASGAEFHQLEGFLVSEKFGVGILEDVVDFFPISDGISGCKQHRGSGVQNCGSPPKTRNSKEDDLVLATQKLTTLSGC